MNTYKHSGAFGDLLYGMVVPRYTGGGEFYLHLNQMDWIGQHYYGSPPAEFHRGRLTQQDFDFMAPFMEAQNYITKFAVLDPATTEISYNLDRFRPDFVNHPCNYIDLYANIFGLYKIDSATTMAVAKDPWLTVPQPRVIAGRPVIVNRTTRWISPEFPKHFTYWKDEKRWEDNAIFVGLEDEYERFIKLSKWNIPYLKANDMLELAEYIAGAQCFVGNQSQCYALAVGLGVPTIRCEIRRDLPKNRNECYFPQRTNIEYF